MNIEYGHDLQQGYANYALVCLYKYYIFNLSLGNVNTEKKLNETKNF